MRWAIWYTWWTGRPRSLAIAAVASEGYRRRIKRLSATVHTW